MRMLAIVLGVEVYAGLGGARVKSLADLRGKTFAFGSVGSTSGT